MQIDSTTLSDLEIFEAGDGSAGLLGLIDRTRTAGGRRALRERMRRPFSDIRLVRQAQAAVRFFVEHPDLIRIEGVACDAVSRYMSSNIELAAATPLRGRVDLAWMSLRYRDLLREIREGVDGTLRFFEDLERLCSSVEALRPPPLISKHIQVMREAAAAVIAEGTRGATVLRVDRSYRKELRFRIEQAFASLSELEALDAMGASTAALRWTMPDLVDSQDFLLEAEGLYHPFVEMPVSNPAHLAGGEPTVFLTGPNMAGKTTYLRSVGLVAYLAQIGMGVPASRARLSPVEALITSLNPADNLKAGVSYFFAEVLRVKTAATLLAEDCRCLVMFDEVFKGTNVKDAMEASAAVILGFAKARRSGCMFSSHLTELVDDLSGDPRIRFCCFDGDVVKGAPSYSYQLKDGVSDQRLGVVLLREARIPELLARITA